MRHSDLIKLNRILGLLGSDHAGERAAAGLAAHRLVKTMGTSWWTLIGTGATPRKNVSPATIVPSTSLASITPTRRNRESASYGRRTNF